MKKLLFMVMLTFMIGFIPKAQDDKDKVKKTSTVPQPVRIRVDADSNEWSPSNKSQTLRHSQGGSHVT